MAQFSEERRAAIAAWLESNDIDPADVPLHSTIVEDRDAGTIRYTAYIRENGRLQVPLAGGPRVIALDELDLPMHEQREVPLIVPAPDHFPA
ncbi:hypothetical protein [Streptomyces subrutilus]|uniref:hypothetical protein n=1 Tax=Streptomyces subrutilus TaxID=36818 RepID=UPI002E164C4D|nr:hypothetical protein OG479_32825 [Streptomyces subrutilus]